MTEEKARQLLEKLRPIDYEKANIINPPMQDDVVLSVIVPVYNTRKYLRQCLNSVIHQKTAYTMQIILVDDGSSDGSADILKTYQSNKSVTIITQKNQGPSGARNQGLNRAVGQYVMFVDSDDILPLDAVQKMLSKAFEYGADIVGGGSRRFIFNRWCSKRQFKIFQDVVIEQWDIENKMKLTGYLWGKIYNRTLFNDIRLPENLLFEDTLVPMILYPKSGKIVWLAGDVYWYRWHRNEIVQTHKEGNRSIDTFWVVEVLLRERNDLNMIIGSYEYNFLLFQLGPMNSSRLASYDEEIQRAVFTLSSALLQKHQPAKKKLNEQQCRIEQIFLTRDFQGWRDCFR